MMERKYKQLPYRFWQEKKYKSEYSKLIIQVNRFLKIYREEALISVFQRYTWLYSLFHPKFKEFLEKEEKIIDQIQFKANQSEKIEEKTEHCNINKSRKIGKLKNLDA